MALRTNNKIRKKHLILCEGRDAEGFLIAFLNSTENADIPEFSTDFQVMDFGGINDLKNYILSLKNMDGFSNVESILIIRDAERDYHAAVQEIQTTLKNCELAVPGMSAVWQGEKLKIGYLLFPLCDGSAHEGTLEDLCAAVLSENRSDELLSDIQLFMNQVATDYNRSYPHEFKTKLHTYFSLDDRFVSLKIGEAAKAGAFNWNHDSMLPIRIFLKQIVDAEKTTSVADGE